jgi:hypothetical protein
MNNVWHRPPVPKRVVYGTPLNQEEDTEFQQDIMLETKTFGDLLTGLQGYEYTRGPAAHVC